MQVGRDKAARKITRSCSWEPLRVLSIVYTAYDVVCWIVSVTKGPLSQEDKEEKGEHNFSLLVNQGGTLNRHKERDIMSVP